MRVQVLVSDPWEFGTECGVSPHGARFIECDDEGVGLFELEPPLEYRSKVFHRFSASARSEADSLEDILAGKVDATVNMQLLDEDRELQRGYLLLGSMRRA